MSLLALPKFTYEVAFDSNPVDPAPVWTDITRWVVDDWSVKRGRSAEMTSTEPGEGSITLKNGDGRFDPMNTASPYNGKLLPLKLLRVSATLASGAVVRRFLGLVLDWPQTWKMHGRYGTVTVPLVDGLRVLAGTEFGNNWDEQIPLDLPTRWFRQAVAPSGGSHFDEISGTYAAGSVSWATTLVPGLGAGNPNQATQSTPGGVAGSGINIGGTALSAETLCRVDSLTGTAASSTYLNILHSTTGGGTDAWIRVATTGGNALHLYFVSLVGGATTTTDLGVFTPAQIHHYALTVVTVGGVSTTFNAYVDGALAASHVRAASSTGAFLVGDTNGAATPTTLVFTLDETLIYGYPLTADQVKLHANIALAPAGVYTEFGPASSDQRTTDILNTAGWPAARRLIHTGGLNLQPTGGVKSKNALTLLQEAAAAELGNVFVNAAGDIGFDTRAWRDSLTVPTVTFGERPNEIGYLGDIAFSFGERTIRNDITVTKTASSPPVLTQTADQTSKDRYFRRPESLDFPYATDADVATTATRLLSQLKDPHLRCERLTVNLAILTPADLAKVLALDIGSLVRVRRRPPAAPVISLDCFIEQVDERCQPGAGQWQIAFTLSPKL